MMFQYAFSIIFFFFRMNAEKATKVLKTVVSKIAAKDWTEKISATAVRILIKLLILWLTFDDSAVFFLFFFRYGVNHF